MRVEIHLLSQSQPIVREGVRNAYVKDGVYCVLLDGKVEKYPLTNIFRVVEPYAA
jgi:chaperone required for assembly of F1-ATPase